MQIGSVEWKVQTVQEVTQLSVVVIKSYESERPKIW